MKAVLIGGGIVLLAVVVLLALTVGGLGARWGLAPFVGAVQEREITNTGAFRIPGIRAVLPLA